MMGLQNDEVSNNLMNEYFQAIHEIYIIIITRFLNFFLHYDFIFNWTTLKKKMDKYLKISYVVSKKVNMFYVFYFSIDYIKVNSYFRKYNKSIVFCSQVVVISLLYVSLWFSIKKINTKI